MQCFMQSSYSFCVFALCFEPSTYIRLLRLAICTASRCRAREQYGLEICTHAEPDLVEVEQNHSVRCWLYQDNDGHKAPLHGS